MITQVEVTEMEENKKMEIEVMRKKIVDATNDASLIIMGLNKELCDLEQSYNASQTESFKWSKVLAVSKECIKDKESTTTQLLDQIQQLYALFCKRNGIPISFERHQIEEQLDYIKDEMKYLQDVIKCAAEINENEDKSIIAQNGSIKK